MNLLWKWGLKWNIYYNILTGEEQCCWILGDKMNVIFSGDGKISSQGLIYKEIISFVQYFTGNLFIKGVKRIAVDKYCCEKVNLFL